jgi:site-specific recombinase XerD
MPSSPLQNILYINAKCSSSETFSYIVTSFFRNYLIAERGLAHNTIRSYSDVMQLLLEFAAARFHVDLQDLCLDQLDRDLIVEFLDYLEQTRGNQVCTRNHRLAVIKTFFHFLASRVPELMQLNAAVQAISEKETHRQPPPSLSVTELKAILAQPDTTRLLGARDHAMLQLFYNSGGRVQEIADLELAQLRDRPHPTVTLTGKGGKTRVIPIWPETLQTINHYLELRERTGIVSEHLFLSARGQPMTRFGIGRRVKKLAQQAAQTCPSLQDRNVTPHVFRHTTALHLLEAGNDIAVVRDWLGHADIKTASDYLEVSPRRKCQALENFPPPAGTEPPELPQWKQPKLMQFLSNLSRGVMLPKQRPIGANKSRQNV